VREGTSTVRPKGIVLAPVNTAIHHHRLTDHLLRLLVGLPQQVAPPEVHEQLLGLPGARGLNDLLHRLFARKNQ